MGKTPPSVARWKMASLVSAGSRLPVTAPKNMGWLRNLSAYALSTSSRENIESAGLELAGRSTSSTLSTSSMKGSTMSTLEAVNHSMSTALRSTIIRIVSSDMFSAKALCSSIRFSVASMLSPRRMPCCSTSLMGLTYMATAMHPAGCTRQRLEYAATSVTRSVSSTLYIAARMSSVSTYTSACSKMMSSSNADSGRLT
ncbi:PP165 [Orf virus]|uniref:PP165 n=1 Tax=Orf virus TaxID=10258 RepID=F1AWZ2_ORFV|nr:PP165 [Orf virus]